jgi:very-short-patch-repair endonuclease
MTTEILKKRLEEIFGNEYDYSKLEYTNSKTKVCVICPKHGEFYSLPHNLIAKKGCPICRYEKSASKNKIPLDRIIEKANLVHDFKYDYSLITEYKNNRIKYPIICHKKDNNGEEHGVFYQDFDHHINKKHGCPHCGGNAKKTTESFVKEAKEIHGNNYDYSKSEYKGIHVPLCIICFKHGEFWQRPNDHLRGQGCPKCRGEKIWNKRGRLTVEMVKEGFKKVHGDEYDYSLFTEYKNNRTKIPIICKKHGVFYVSPNNHLMGRGCPKCKSNKISEKQRLSINEVVERIKKVHGDKFIIPNDFEYKNNQAKVKLICKEHGEFHQNPFNLWKGVGCPKCNKSKLENEMSMILKENNIAFEEQKKFDWLGNLELDFYLPQYNTAIECQGIQHFKPIDIFGGEKQLKQQKEWDQKKKTLCEEHGIKIIYFSNNKVKDQLKEEFPYAVLTDKSQLLTELSKSQQ